MGSPFEPTSLEKQLHVGLQAMGIISIATAIPPILYLLSKDARSNMNRFRWLLLAIAISGLLMDLQISLALSPYPLLPHIAFWADGLLVRIHKRAIVYLMALVLFFIYLWVTMMLLAFIFRLAAVLDRSHYKRIIRLAYCAVALGVFNTSMSCGILLVKYPSQARVETYITENVPVMKFLLETPGFIYFTRMDQYHYAQIGMAHLIVCILFYMLAFVGVFVIINLMLLPLFSLIVPFLMTAISLRFGKDGDGIDHQLIAHFSLILASLHSILNTFSMFTFVSPFRRYLSSRVAPMDTIDSQTISRSTQFSSVNSPPPIANSGA